VSQISEQSVEGADQNDAPKIILGHTNELTVEVDDLDGFVTLLTGWHVRRVDTVKHLLEIPEGTVFEVGNGAKSVTLAGDTLAGFKFGLEMALMQLGKLPFVAEIEDEKVEAEGVAG